MNESEDSQQPARPPGVAYPQLSLRTLVMMIMTGAAVYLCYRLTEPFLPVFAGALALAVVFAPMHRWIEAHVRRRDLAATLSIVLILAIVVVPATFVVERIISEAARAGATLRTMVEGGEWRSALLEQPRLAPIGLWLERYFDVPGVVQRLAAWLTDGAASFVRGSIAQLLAAVLTFYALFYFLRDHDAVLNRLRSMAPVSRPEIDALFKSVFDTVHATVYGTLVVAAVQGLLGGLMFWWLGLPEPVLWGVVMALLAIVPVLGAFIVWLPAAGFLLLSGEFGKAALLAVWGAVVVGGIDNLLYPILVGERMKMHSLVAFVAIVGGLLVLGPSGVILGPVAFTITRVLLEIWARRSAGGTGERTWP